MPQEFHVVRCFKCEAFQVHIVKKVPKWECKICGEKQSVRQVYGKGTGKDCRLHVQKLNALRADEISENIEEVIEYNEDLNENSSIIEVNDSAQPSNSKHKQSKWAEFLDEKSETRCDDEVDDNTIPCSKKPKLSDTKNYNNSFSELSKRNPSKIDFRIRNQKTIESYFNSVSTAPGQKAFTEKEVPIKSENPLKNLKSSDSKNSAYNDKIQYEQLHRKTIYEPLKENRKTVTENMSNIISNIISCNEQIKSDNNTDQLYRKTIFESFKDNDNLDSILDTDF